MVFIKNKKLFILHNIMFFIIYIIILHIYNMNVITLHNQLLKQDDIIHKHESYIQYIKRIWHLPFKRN